jgi:hypothetical protein
MYCQEYKNIKQFNNQWGLTEATRMGEIGDNRYIMAAVIDGFDTTFYDDRVLYVGKPNEKYNLNCVIKLDSLNNYIDHFIAPDGPMEIGDNKIFIQTATKVPAPWSPFPVDYFPKQKMYIYDSDLKQVDTLISERMFVDQYKIKGGYLYLNGNIKTFIGSDTAFIGKDTIYHSNLYKAHNLIKYDYINKKIVWNKVYGYGGFETYTEDLTIDDEENVYSIGNWYAGNWICEDDTLYNGSNPFLYSTDGALMHLNKDGDLVSQSHIGGDNSSQTSINIRIGEERNAYWSSTLGDNFTINGQEFFENPITEPKFGMIKVDENGDRVWHTPYSFRVWDYFYNNGRLYLSCDLPMNAYVFGEFVPGFSNDMLLELDANTGSYIRKILYAEPYDKVNIKKILPIKGSNNLWTFSRIEAWLHTDKIKLGPHRFTSLNKKNNSGEFVFDIVYPRTTATEELDKEKIFVYPNPVPKTGMVYLQGITDATEINILDQYGRMRYKAYNKSSIDLSELDLSTGTYHIQVQLRGKKYSSKIVVIE